MDDFIKELRGNAKSRENYMKEENYRKEIEDKKRIEEEMNRKSRLLSEVRNIANEQYIKLIDDIKSSCVIAVSKGFFYVDENTNARKICGSIFIRYENGSYYLGYTIKNRENLELSNFEELIKKSNYHYTQVYSNRICISYIYSSNQKNTHPLNVQLNITKYKKEHHSVIDRRPVKWNLTYSVDEFNYLKAFIKKEIKNLEFESVVYSGYIECTKGWNGDTDYYVYDIKSENFPGWPHLENKVINFTVTF